MTHSELFDQHRPHLFSIAYRKMGSAAEAEDMVQEAFVHWLRVADTRIQSPKAYLTTIITRLCLDQQRSALRRHEIPFSPVLTEPLLDEEAANSLTAAEATDSLGLALAVLLEKLAPLERAVFLLREVFDYDYREVACLVGKSEANCRQIVRRARQRIHAQRPHFEVAVSSPEGITREFLEACLGGDMSELITLLTERQLSNWPSRVAQCCR